jgi:cyclic pyranopterin phosphate synthase
MPEEGINYVQRSDLLTYEEMIRLSRVLVKNGIDKIRITGGEPFLRKDLMDFIREMSSLPGLASWHLTTNGVLTIPHLSALKSLGIGSVNLSLDSLDRDRFFKITRRDELPAVLDCLNRLVELDIPTKINMVVMANENIEDIIPMIELTRQLPISVRFLEEMPFNGSENAGTSGNWTHVDILQHIKSHYTLTALPLESFATATRYSIEGYQGDIGIIASYSRTFCGTCNRLRLTPTGTIKTCLYDNGIFNLRDMIRSGANDEQLIQALRQALNVRAIDGHAAEKARATHLINESMAMIGG